VCAAYYIGANLGFFLRFPPATPSVLWPPNSILTAALLLTPPRRWRIYLIAALPAHLAAELQLAWPTPLVLALFLTNCSEALIAAGCLRALSDPPTCFGTLRRMVVFVLTVGLLAPFASSFLDAGVVELLHGEPYWAVWRTRFPSNVVTELTLVPAIVIVITSGRAWIRGASLRRWFEGALLALGLTAVARMYFVDAVDGGSLIPGSPHTTVAFFLPFGLWTAVRFGPGGASLSLLATTLIAIHAAAHGRGPFTTLPPAESVLALQIWLSVSAIPLLCLAGLIEERRRNQQALAERLRFEELLARSRAASCIYRATRWTERSRPGSGASGGSSKSTASRCSAFPRTGKSLPWRTRGRPQAWPRCPRG
jgi:integral membrane sensor domain MASE1